MMGCKMPQKNVKTQLTVCARLSNQGELTKGTYWNIEQWDVPVSRSDRTLVWNAMEVAAYKPKKCYPMTAVMIRRE